MTGGSLSIGLVGGAGRMGQRLLHLLQAHPHARVGAVLQHRTPVPLPPGSTTQVVKSAEELVGHADVVVDFSAPAAIASVLPACQAQRVPVVVASTALGEADADRLTQAAEHLPIVLAANLSVGIAVLGELVRAAAGALPRFDVEVVESHHRHKRDAPSGTALYLVERAQAARSSLTALAGREGSDLTRQPDEIGVHAVRGGDVAGEHHVLFLGDGERLELTHRSHDRDVFARGAVVAARWLQSRAPGLYSMRDVVAQPHGPAPGR